MICLSHEQPVELKSPVCAKKSLDTPGYIKSKPYPCVMATYTIYPSALGGLKLCAATSMSTSQHDCISNSKFQQKTHNHIHTTYGFGLLGTFPHKSICLPTSCVFFHFPATHFTLLCITRCLFNKEEEASGQRDISQSEEKGRH